MQCFGVDLNRRCDDNCGIADAGMELLACGGGFIRGKAGGMGKSKGKAMGWEGLMLFFKGNDFVMHGNDVVKTCMY